MSAEVTGSPTNQLKPHSPAEVYLCIAKFNPCGKFRLGEKGTGNGRPKQTEASTNAAWSIFSRGEHSS